MDVISIPTEAQRLERMARDPVIFAKEVNSDFDPRPCQQDMLHWIPQNDTKRAVGITKKMRQCGASTTMSHAIAYCLWVKDSGWKTYIIAPNEDVAALDLNPVYSIFEHTPILKSYLKGSKKNDLKFSLGYKDNSCQIILVGDKPDSKRGSRFNNSVGGLLLFEEIDVIPNAKKVMSVYRPAASWSALTFFVSTPAGHSGPFYDKYNQVKTQQDKGNSRYRVFDFPLRQFLAIPENGNKGIGVDFVREMKQQEPNHIFMREYLGRFAEESDGTWFEGKTITKAWQTHQDESITYDDSKPLVLGIDWGTFDRSVLTYAQDNVIEDRLEAISITTFRERRYCKDGDTPIHSLDDVVKAVCNMRDRGYAPDMVYVDRNNRGGVFCDKLENEHGFNVVDCSWNSYEAKLRALNSLRNLIRSGALIFPRDARLLHEFSRFCPEYKDGRWRWTDRNDDIIVTLCNLTAHLAREEGDVLCSGALGAPQFERQIQDTYGTQGLAYIHN